MNYFMIRGRSMKQVYNSSEECSVDSAILISVNNTEYLLMGNENSKTLGDLLITYFTEQGDRDTANKLMEANVWCYKLYNSWEDIETLEKSITTLCENYENPSNDNKLVRFLAQTKKDIAEVKPLFREDIVKNIRCHREEIVKVLGEKGVKLISVWVDSFKKNSSWRRRSLNFIQEPVEVIGNVHVQTNAACEIFEEFYKRK